VPGLDELSGNIFSSGRATKPRQKHGLRSLARWRVAVIYQTKTFFPFAGLWILEFDENPSSRWILSLISIGRKLDIHF
jgi:hypothetical protein